jgi:hypothetical protein
VFNPARRIRQAKVFQRIRRIRDIKVCLFNINHLQICQNCFIVHEEYAKREYSHTVITRSKSFAVLFQYDDRYTSTTEPISVTNRLTRTDFRSQLISQSSKIKPMDDSLILKTKKIKEKQFLPWQLNLQKHQMFLKLRISLLNSANTSFYFLHNNVFKNLKIVGAE